MLTSSIFLASAFALFTPTVASARPYPGWEDTEPELDEPLAASVDRVVERQHQIALGSGVIDYVSHAGVLVLREEDGTPRADVYYTAYFKAAVEDRDARPITFCFNGGPGSSSVWLHLGAIGPRRVDLGEEGWNEGPPYSLVDNDQSWLDLTDLVFIDPVTTGYSRPAEDREGEEFHGVEEDLESVGEFIRLFTTRHERWGSPKFLAGESYGTTRAAGLALHLSERHGIELNGLVLVSSILSFQTARFDPGNDLPYELFLPTYAATARYHGRLPETEQGLPAFLDEVREFAGGDYAAALRAGGRLGAQERGRIADRLVAYTGLSKEYLLANHLRPQIHRFVKELRRDEGVTVGRLDSRYTSVDRDSGGEHYEFDPSYAAIQGPYTAMLNRYVRSELGFESDLPYEILTGRVHPWSYATARNQYLNVAERLRKAMARNPRLRVYIANGYYDLATPFFATERTIDHLDLSGQMQSRIAMGYFESGHMMYVQRRSLVQLKEEVATLYATALGAEEGR